MEKIKIFATKDAYEVLTDKENPRFQRSVIRFAIEQMNYESERSTDCFSKISTMGVSARWTKKSDGTSVMLFYKQKTPAFQYEVDDENFWADVSTAIPIDFI